MVRISKINTTSGSTFSVMGFYSKSFKTLKGAIRYCEKNQKKYIVDVE